MMVGLKRISTALGLLAAMASSALAQGSAPNANQLTADAVAGTLRASRNLAGYRIEIQARDGLVTLTGALGSPAQKAEALARTRYVAGVRGVVDQLQVANDRSVRTVQYQPNPGLAFRPDYAGGDRRRCRLWRRRCGVRRPDQQRPDHRPARSPMAGRFPKGRPAWRVRRKPLSPAIPTTHGPAMLRIPTSPRSATRRLTPGKPGRTSGRSIRIPEVPLDWRAVTLRWDDGIWWLDFKKHYTRPVLHSLSVWPVRLLTGVDRRIGDESDRKPAGSQSLPAGSILSTLAIGRSDAPGQRVPIMCKERARCPPIFIDRVSRPEWCRRLRGNTRFRRNCQRNREISHSLSGSCSITRLVDRSSDCDESPV